jgi:fructokinase
MVEAMADPRKTVIGIGELLWDCFGDSKRPGGAPANVAFHAGQLGADGIVCSRVGDDDLGTQLVSYIEQRGLSARYIQRDPQHPTGTVTVNATRPDHPEYIIHEDVAWDHMTFDDTWPELLANASAVCFGTLAQRSPASRRAITQALDHATGALLVYDVNLRSPFWNRELIESSLHRADVVKLNIHEVSVLARLLAPDADSPGRLGEFLVRNYEVRLICVTRGAQGCVLISPDETVDVAGRRVTVADAVGAGDAFTAALVWGLLRKWEPRAVAGFANEVGALVASRHGAMPALRDEFATLQSAMDGGGDDTRRA